MQFKTFKILVLLINMTVISLANVCYSQNNWTTKKDKIKIPFELTHNLIILDVDFNGTPLKMILDTGASNNMIFSVSENDSIIMNDANKITISGAGNTEDIEGYLSRKNRLKIRDYIANDFEVVFATNQDISIVNKLGITINGILGSSFFKDNLIEIDYQSRKIIIYKDKQAKLKKIANKYTKLQVEINKNRPYVSLEAKIEDSNHKLKLLFDTGLGDGLWLFENDSIKCNSNFFIDILGRGLSGDVEGKKSRVKEVTFPNSSLKKVLVSYPDKKFFDQFKILKNRNGSLGGDIIKRFNWFFDYENQTFYYKKNTFFDLPFEYNMSGIEVQHAGSQWVKDEVSDNSSGIPIKVNEFNFENPNANTKFNYKYELKPIFEIYAVRVNSSAAKAGLKVGDIILKINNKSSNRLNIQSITNLFQSEDGKLINITIERNGKKLDFEFSLEKIL